MTTPPTLGPKALFRNRTFLLLEGRGTTNSVAYVVFTGTLLWLSYRLTSGIFLAGVLVGVQTAVFTLTFLISPLVDRVYDKRRVYLFCYPIQAAAAIVLGLSYVAGALTVPLLLAIVVLLSVLWDLTEATDVTTTRLLFGKDSLFVISGLSSAIGGGVDIAMYFVAGVTLAIFGVVGGFYLVSGLLAVGTMLAIPLPIPTPSITKQAWLSGLREGWGLFRGNTGRPLRHLAVLQFVTGFFVTAPTLLLTLGVGQFFSGSQATYAELYVAYLIGGIAMGIILGYLNPRGYVGLLSIGATFVMGLVLLGTEVATISTLLSVATWLVVGMVNPGRAQLFWIYLQGRFEPDVISRVSMNVYLFSGASSAIGAFAIGALSTSWGLQSLTWLVAIGFIGSAALGLALQGVRSLTF